MMKLAVCTQRTETVATSEQTTHYPKANLHVMSNMPSATYDQQTKPDEEGVCCVDGTVWG